MKNNQWLEKEISHLNFERKTNKVNDNKILIRCLCFLLPLLAIVGVVHAQDIHTLSSRFETTVAAQWRCSTCGRYNYSETTDWKGDFYCICGTRMGD